MSSSAQRQGELARRHRQDDAKGRRAVRVVRGRRAHHLLLLRFFEVIPIEARSDVIVIRNEIDRLNRRGCCHCGEGEVRAAECAVVQQL